jgi:uncharacterized Zn finger protein
VKPCSNCNSIDVQPHYVWGGSRHHLAQRCNACGQIDAVADEAPTSATEPVSEFDAPAGEAIEEATTDEEPTAEEPEAAAHRVRTRRNG